MIKDKYIQEMESGNIEYLTSTEVLEELSQNQDYLKQVLQKSLINDNYLAVTKNLWQIVQEDDIGLKKYDFYCHVLKQTHFSEKTARYICLKERDLKIVNTGLLGKCGTVKAVDFLMNAYGLGIHNIIEGVATCSNEEQIPIMIHLLSRLNELQISLACDKFIGAYLEDYPKELGLVSFVLRQKKVWNQNVLENEKIKKLMLYNTIDQKLTEHHHKVKKQKI